MKNYLLILLLLTSTNTFAALNKWVDANGKVHYSDGPPPVNVKAEKIHSDLAPVQPASSTPSATKTDAEGKVTENKPPVENKEAAKKAAADKAAQEQAKKEENKARCAAAQQNLRTFQDGIRIVEIDAKGERVYLDDAQRQQRIAKAQQDISTYCK